MYTKRKGVGKSCTAEAKWPSPHRKERERERAQEREDGEAKRRGAIKDERVCGDAKTVG